MMEALLAVALAGVGMMRYKVESSSVLTPQTISLRFSGGAWARMTFTETNKDQWHVQINSDWGSWEYWWSRSGMGTDIFKFMNPNRSYFWEKFTSQEPRIPDIEGTKTNLRKAVREHFNDRYWDNKEEWQEAMRIISELNFETFDGFMYQDIPKEIDNERWHFYKDMDHPRSTFFFKKIFPKFTKHIKKLGREYDKKREPERSKAPVKTKAQKLKSFSGTPPVRGRDKSTL